jgi:hypothetical protein
LLELLIHQPIFIGLKADNNLRQLLESLNDSDKRYVSGEDSTFLRICRVGEDIYVGKLVHESLTTDQVEDIRRNVLSIIRKIGSEARLPTHLRIFACSATEAEFAPSASS